MGNIKCVILVIWVISMWFTPVDAWVGESFRRQATAGLLDDDLDLWLNNSPGLLANPVGLTYIDGMRVYTNLSNLVSGSETQFSDNQSENAYLLGGSGHFIFGSGGLLYNTSRFEELLENALGQYGESESIRTIWSDENGDHSTYDMRTDIEARANARQERSTREMFLGYANAIMYTRFGLLYKYRTQTEETPRSFSEQQTLTQLVWNQVTTSERQSQEELYKTSQDEHLFVASVRQEYSSYMRFGGQIGLGFQSTEQQDYQWSEEWQNRAPADTLLRDHTHASSATDQQMPLSIMDFYLGVNAQYHWSANQTTWVDLLWKHSSGDVDSDAKIYRSHVSEEWYTLGEFDQFTRTTENDSASIKGDLSRDEVTFYTRTVYRFIDRAKFAYGFGVTTGKETFEQTFNRHVYNTTTVNDGDNEPNDGDDSAEEVIAHEIESTKQTTAETVLKLPVAMEFALTKKIDLRLGALHTITTRKETLTRQFELNEPPLQVITYGDGRVVSSIQPEAYEVQTGTSEKHNTTMTHTEYTYGAGYHVNTNFQIDLMGFAKLTDLSAWQLSATIKF
ncbi:MAG: hypothetical protein D6675_14165 [Gemmatimonadetes bacterium]|nr:MAG: hypothetical protein D6675_14165 [Gemmatimonadota bacterium]